MDSFEKLRILGQATPLMREFRLYQVDYLYTGAVIKRALPFITINGRTPESHQPEQLSFLTDAR